MNSLVGWCTPCPTLVVAEITSNRGMYWQRRISRKKTQLMFAARSRDNQYYRIGFSIQLFESKLAAAIFNNEESMHGGAVNLDNNKNYYLSVT